MKFDRIRKHLAIILIFIFCFLGNNAQSQPIDYPFHFTFTGNPLVRNHGAADPDVHVWGDTIWMYCSQDHEGGYANMDGYHAFSSTDLINWTDRGDVFNSTMLDENRWGRTPDHWMWAPGAARKKNEYGEWIYYLYYPHNVKFDGQNWVTGVATAKTPAGPFTDQGPLKNGKMGMDPMVFIDDNGEAYIYSNSLIVAKLNPDMVSLAESPRKISYAPSNVINDENLRFGEGSYMHKKDGVYYFSYSNFHNDVHQGFYAMGDNPYGPFEWKGPMAPNPQGAQDHHSVIEFQDKWYYFYHIAIPDIPENKDGQSRITCFDRLFYNEDGTIKKVEHTRNILSYEPSQKAFNNTIWQFPGDTVTAWQFDYFNQYDYFNKTYGDTLFSLDSAKTIGIHGCNDTSGVNIRSYKDIEQFKDAAQLKWDSSSQTFAKNGQWIEYSVGFNSNEPYQLLIRARSDNNANFNLEIYNSQGDTVYHNELNLMEDFKNLGGENQYTDWLISKFVITKLRGTCILRFDWYDNIGEPGIFGGFSFLNSDLDLTPPEWYYVSVGAIPKGDDITVMTTEDAKVYLVPEGTLSDTILIGESAIVSTEVVAYSQEKIATSGLSAGNYIVYAIDSSNNISEASRLITLEIPINSPVISNNSEISITYNPVYKFISIKGKNEIRQIDIYDILGRKVKSIIGNGKTYDLQINGFNPGIYVIFVNDIYSYVKQYKIHIE